MNKKRDLLRKYDCSVETYDQRYKSIQKEKFDFLKSYLGNYSRLLEVGCGTGYFLKDLSCVSDEVFGVDFSKNMIKVAKERFEKSNLVISDADYLPFNDNSFECVISFTLLQNLPNPSKTISEMVRVSKINGKILGTVLKKIYEGNDVKKWLISSGLKNIRIEKIPNSEDIMFIGEV